MFVLKFGGTSVGSPQGIVRIMDILKDKDHCPQGQINVPVVVVSAFSGITNALIDMAGATAEG